MLTVLVYDYFCLLGKEEECTSFISIQDVPNTYMIRSLHFIQDSLGLWATHHDGTSDGFYRLPVH